MLNSVRLEEKERKKSKFVDEGKNNWKDKESRINRKAKIGMEEWRRKVKLKL